MVAIIELIVIVIMVASNWMIFQKAGEPGWAAIIPFYNTYVLFKIVTGNGWKMFFLIIPFFNIVYGIMMMFKLAKAFGQGTGFGFGLLFLGFIFEPILAFGDAEYVGPQ